MPGPLHRVLVPAPSVDDRGDQARVRLLQGFLIVASAVAFTRGTAQAMSTPQLSSTPMVLGACLALVGALLVARTRAWRLSAAIAALVPTLVPMGIGLRHPLDPTWFAITVLGTLLASTFFSLRVGAATAAFTLTGVAAVISLSPGLHTPARAIPILAFVVVTTGLFLFIAWHRDHLADLHANELLARERQRGQALRLEAVGRLAAGVAHDSNNLLTVVMCNTEMVMKRADDETTWQLAQEILEASERTTSLISGLLAFTKQQHREASNVDLGDLVEQLVPVLDRLVGDGVALRFERSDTALPVEVDREHVVQVVLNLVVNARDATPRGGSITLSVGPDPSESTAGWLRVADTGTGIPADVLDRVFEPFFTTKANGTGLGLAIIHDNVVNMGGHIEVESSSNGTTFHVRLPLSKAPEPAASQEEDSDTTGVRLLLVDDDELVRRVTHRGLEAAGYTVVSVASGEAALERLASGTPFSLLVTDIHIPQMTGPQLVVAARSIAPSLPALFISSYEPTDLPEGAAARTQFLAKPFAPDEIGRAVEVAIRFGSDQERTAR